MICYELGHALCLPVPEKTQKQFNFCIIPEYADGITPPPEGTATSEAMVFTIADGPAKAAFSGDGKQLGQGPGESAEAFIRKILDENMAHTRVVRPDDKQFVSAMPEAHRKGEKAYHVKAFRGSKEGMLHSYFHLTGSHCASSFISIILTYFGLRQAISSFFLPVSYLHSRNRSCSSHLQLLTLFRIHPSSSGHSISMSWLARRMAPRKTSRNSSSR